MSVNTQAQAGSAPILAAERISKSYGTVRALKNINLTINRGEVLALIGDNGAGKSTLIKTLSGAIKPDKGRLVYDGEEVTFNSPHDARERGIETVYQDLALAPNLDIASNLFLGREVRQKGLLGRLGFMDERSMARDTKERLAKLGIHMPAVLGLEARRLSGGERQVVAIARASVWARGVLIMDEPTAALGVRQSELVLELARRVAEQGVGVVIISHTLPHVMTVADRIVVLRHGAKVADLPRVDATPEGLVALIVGADPGDVETDDGWEL
jgi:simple sugar transport system ATP-binding protein